MPQDAAFNSRDFTSSDGRLRPRGRVQRDGVTQQGPYMLVTRANFPELYDAFSHIAQGSGYQLAIINDYDNAHRYPSIGVIGIGLDLLNRMRLEDVLFVAGHELGHVHQSRRLNSERLYQGGGQDVPYNRYIEHEADRYAACVAGGPEVGAQALRRIYETPRSNDPYYPTRDERIDELDRHSNFLCHSVQGGGDRIPGRRR